MFSQYGRIEALQVRVRTRDKSKGWDLAAGGTLQTGNVPVLANRNNFLVRINALLTAWALRVAGSKSTARTRRR